MDELKANQIPVGLLSQMATTKLYTAIRPPDNPLRTHDWHVFTALAAKGAGCAYCGAKVNTWCVVGHGRAPCVASSFKAAASRMHLNHPPAISPTRLDSCPRQVPRL
jgi:hypothetical protein